MFGDPIIEAKDLLKKHGVHVREPNPGHLKFGPINFWPTTGRIHFDDEKESRPDKGLRALEKIIVQIKMDRLR